MDTYTPPDTLLVKDDLIKHRSAINELKQAYDLTAIGGRMDSPLDSPMETPVATVAGPRAGGVRFAPVPEDTPFTAADTPAPARQRSSQELLQEVLLFSNPAVSGLVLLAGTALIAGVHFLLSASPLTFLSALSYLLLADVALNFLCSLVLRKWSEQGQWSGSTAVRALVERLASAVDLTCQAHDQFLSARDPVVTLRVACGLWLLAVVGSYLSLWNVVTLAFILAFTIPVGYQTYKAPINILVQNVTRIVKSRWDALGLSRKQKAAGLSVLLIMLWVRSSWSTRLVALLVGALAVRCHLKPAEVDAIRTHAEPYTQSVKKSARRLSIAATDFAHRTLGAKTHFR
ncbi:hypothetical protein N2152v2_010592 [Parachlorella kessleri]